ncbi:hypothetical protein [Natrinema sp. 1APR25-10V2]|uniref:hypothetical protein n=1 Tax=Natrinema sp. 1APR25-10V2 TaxID=2951081 RepID=UPI002875FAD0|nr:hypothetical protein [Natrinema sp. 1APR25-10V2]MDS0475275.1 hypothetical protein [Natrinema sp. 1APR25-10V2]
MAAHRPIAHRAFSVLLVALLLGSVVAPIAASSPAAAQDSDSCYDEAAYLLSTCVAGDIETTSYDGDPAATQTTLHGMAVSEWESEQSIRTVLRNYAEDTPTIASLEGRNAIATAYEQGNTTTEADDMARSEIQDYYSQKQVNALETYSKQQAQLAHIGNITNEPDVHKSFVYNPVDPNWGGDADTPYLTGDLVNHTYTLANGTTHQYQAAKWEVYVTQFADGSTTNSGSHIHWYSIPIGLNMDGDDYAFSLNGPTSKNIRVTNQINVRNSYEGTSYDTANGLPGQKVSDPQAWNETVIEWSNQSQTMISNYQNIASDLYTEMDAGRLEPNELRGAEGMVRYLSGDSNATEGDYRTALAYTLDTSNPNLTETSTMKVHIDGYTGITWNESTTDGASREPIPTNPVNKTIEGLLFTDGVDSVSVSQTYTTNATDSKSFYVIDENGTQTTLIDGNLTVEAIYDSSGNEVKNATYTDPKYDSYNASDFISYLNKSEEVRAALLSDGSDSGGVTIGDLFGGNPAIGLVVVGAVVALFVAGKASN